MSEKMKDSGIEWIGEIPENWDIVKVKHLFHIGRGRVISKLELEDKGIYPVYSSQTKNNGCLGYIKTYDFTSSQLTWTTDGANAGTVFLREGKHNCTNVCGTLLQKNSQNNLKYLKYDLQYIAKFHKRADINGYKIMNNEMANIKILLPPIKEQEKISNYLDEKVSQIDAIMSKTKETIEEYKEYKKSIITEVVTKGLDKDAKMKNSGVEWIGEIPENWKAAKIKTKFNINTGKNISKELFSDDGLYDIIGANGSIGKTNIFNNDEEVITTGRVGTIGKCHIINKAWVTDNVLILKNKFTKKNNCTNKFLFYMLPNLDFNQITSQVVQKIITASNLKNQYILVPPTEEQKKITEYLDKKTSEIDKLISEKEKLISELENYKKSLIYECVTGKKEIV